MLDQRSLAEKSADLELQVVREELMAWGDELSKAWQSGFEDEADYMPFGC